MSGYKAIFPVLLEKAGIERLALDRRLQDLIGKFEKAMNAVRLEVRSDLLNVLIQVDAIICADLFRQYGVLPDMPAQASDNITKINKVKAMALKAKALKLKWKTKEALSV